MMYGNGWNFTSAWGWVGMALMTLFWFGFIVLIIYAISRAFWHPGQTPATTSEQDRAMGVLRERFARGEITEDEYRQVSNTLHDTAR